MVASFPALTEGNFRIIRILVSDAEFTHGEIDVEVSVKVTVPLVMSVVPGV